MPILIATLGYPDDGEHPIARLFLSLKENVEMDVYLCTITPSYHMDIRIVTLIRYCMKKNSILDSSILTLFLWRINIRGNIYIYNYIYIYIYIYMGELELTELIITLASSDSMYLSMSIDIYY